MENSPTTLKTPKSQADSSLEHPLSLNQTFAPGPAISNGTPSLSEATFDPRQLELPLNLPKPLPPPAQLELSLHYQPHPRVTLREIPPTPQSHQSRAWEPERCLEIVRGPVHDQPASAISAPLGSHPSSRSSILSEVPPQLNELPLEFYGTIRDFCKVREIDYSSGRGLLASPFSQNQRRHTTRHESGPSERVKFLTRILRDLNIPFILDVFQDNPCYPVTPSEERVNTHSKHPPLSFASSLLAPSLKLTPRFLGRGSYTFNTSSDLPVFFYNIILPGKSDIVVLAHHDVLNRISDNANDNSASVINAIATKRLRPDLTVVLSDGEEPPHGGAGARRLARQIHAKVAPFGEINAVVNLELTGIGGPNFVVGDVDEPCTNHIVREFGCPRITTPSSDSTILLSAGIPSAVLVTLPVESDENAQGSHVLLPDGRKLNKGIISLIHTKNDSADTINPAEMKAFVEKRLVLIADSFARTKGASV